MDITHDCFSMPWLDPASVDLLHVGTLILMYALTDRHVLFLIHPGNKGLCITAEKIKQSIHSEYSPFVSFNPS
jgi:hypothetical protein